MSSPEDKEKHRKRFRNKYAKEVRSRKYQSRVIEDKTKKAELKDLTHAELVKLINEEEDDN